MTHTILRHIKISLIFACCSGLLSCYASFNPGKERVEGTNTKSTVASNPEVNGAKETSSSSAIARDQPSKINNTESIETHKEAVAKTKVVGDLWDRMRIGFEFSDIHVDNKDAQKRIEYHRQRLVKTPTLIKRVTDNATPYFYHIVSQLEQNNLPLEIAILPIIESHYDAFAYSPGRASGLWQFIPGTGKRFGLNQDWWHDERRDTVAATGAAIQYLIYLHKMFDGDWLLAMASYNAGQGRVLKAVKKNRRLGKATDYWSLDLPKETQHYIPKLLAWRDIIQDQNHYNISFNPIPDKPYFDIVDIGSQIDLAQVAELAQVDIETIYQLNPAFNRWATDPSPPHDLLIPFDKVDLLKRELNNLPAQDRMTWRRYVIKKNDSLSKIAAEFDTSSKLIASVNGIKNGRIQAGKALMIPSASRASDYYSNSAEQRLAKKQNRAPNKNANKVLHSVKSGESLWDISQRYKVKVSSLARWNNMAPKDTLAVNRKLTVWTKSPKIKTVNQSSAKNETRKLFYKVKKGDSLSGIASRFKVNTNDIKMWNTDAQNKYIKPGQVLTLYVALTDRELLIN